MRATFIGFTFLMGLNLAAVPAYAGPDFFPGFYGEYVIRNWTCESTLKDPGCLDSARIVIENRDGLSNIHVFNANGGMIRTNELKEKADASSSYILSGDDNSAAYTVEAKNSAGKRYFYNLLEIRRQSDGTFRFTQLQESELGGLGQKVRRIFELARNPL